jgi:hypothetical protein
LACWLISEERVRVSVAITEPGRKQVEHHDADFGCADSCFREFGRDKDSSVHGANSRDAVRQMPVASRNALIAFLMSL